MKRPGPSKKEFFVIAKESGKIYFVSLTLKATVSVFYANRRTDL
jgi:hypothetical protein